MELYGQAFNLPLPIYSVPPVPAFSNASVFTSSIIVIDLLFVLNELILLCLFWRDFSLKL